MHVQGKASSMIIPLQYVSMPAAKASPARWLTQQANAVFEWMLRQNFASRVRRYHHGHAPRQFPWRRFQPMTRRSLASSTRSRRRAGIHPDRATISLSLKYQVEMGQTRTESFASSTGLCWQFEIGREAGSAGALSTVTQPVTS